MKVLLIGKKGQLGHELDIQAKKFGFDIISLSKEELNITDSKKIYSEISSHKPDIVINATAYHFVPDCEKNPEIAFEINAIAVRDVAQLTESLGIQFVTYSTDYVFDGEKGRPYIEDDLPSPRQTYGVSKVAGENFALSYNKKSVLI